MEEVGKGQAEYTAIREGDDPESIFDWIEARHPGITENFGLSNLPQLARRTMGKVAAMVWHPLDFRGGRHRLLCSDRPCVFTSGIDDPDCIVALPLSPQHAFIAFYEGSKAQAALRGHGPTVIAKAVNRHVVQQAKQRAYCQRGGDAPDEFFARYLVRQESPGQPRPVA